MFVSPVAGYALLKSLKVTATLVCSSFIFFFLTAIINQTHVKQISTDANDILFFLSFPFLLQSRTSLVSSSEGGILAEGETSSEEESSRDSSDNSPPCDLGLTERLLLTHPMWFLPGIQRSGAVHLLQGKEEGVSLLYVCLPIIMNYY